MLLLLPIEGHGMIAEHVTLIARLLPPVVLLFLTGLVDDWLTIKPWQKLIGQVAASMWAWESGVRIEGIAGTHHGSVAGFHLHGGVAGAVRERV